MVTPNWGMGPPWGAFCQITLTTCYYCWWQFQQVSLKGHFFLHLSNLMSVLLCADVPLRNYSLTHINTNDHCMHRTFVLQDFWLGRLESNQGSFMISNCKHLSKFCMSSSTNTNKNYRTCLRHMLTDAPYTKWHQLCSSTKPWSEYELVIALLGTKTLLVTFSV